MVRVGDHEAFRTSRSYPVPSDARAAVEQLLAHVLGTLLGRPRKGQAAPVRPATSPAPAHGAPSWGPRRLVGYGAVPPGGPDPRFLFIR